MINLDELDNVQDLNEQLRRLEGSENELVALLSAVGAARSSIKKLQLEIARQKARDTEKRYEDYLEASREYRDIKDRLLEFPTLIQEQKDHIAGLEEAVKQAEQEMASVEIVMIMAIQEETDDNGKKRFSNQALRDAELTRRQNEYWKQKSWSENTPVEDTVLAEDYITAREELEDAKRNLDQVKFELDRLYNEFKSWQHIASMNASRMEMLG